MWELNEGVINGLLAVGIPAFLWLVFGDRIMDRYARLRRRIKRHAH